MQVLTTLGMRIVSIPAGSDSGKGPDVFFFSTRIEDEPLADRLEESKVGISLVGLFVDVIPHHVVLIDVDQALDAVTDNLNTEGSVLLDGDGLSLQVHLFHRELTDFLAVVRTADGIVGSHSRIFCLDLNGLG